MFEQKWAKETILELHSSAHNGLVRQKQEKDWNKMEKMS